MLLALLVLSIILGAFAGYLATSNPPPRQSSDGWVRVKSMPSARGEVGEALVEARAGGPSLCPTSPCGDRLVYVVGGRGGALGSVSKRVDVFDPPAASWRRGPDLPEPRHDVGAVGLSDTLYVTGGVASSTGFKPETNVWVLRPGRLSFERRAAMPEPRAGHGAVAVGSKIYVVAGAGPSSNVLIFDPASGWKTGSAMPVPRDHAAVVAVGKRIYVLGGRTARGLTSRVDIYDTAADSWSSGPDLPIPNSAMAAGQLSDGLIHIMGGENPKLVGGNVRDKHFALDPVGGIWLEGPKPLLAVHGAPGVVVQGKLLVIGGSRRQGLFSTAGWTGLAQVFDPALLPGGPGSGGAPGAPSPKPSLKPSSAPKPSGAPKPTGLPS